MPDTIQSILAIQFVGCFMPPEDENFRRCNEFAMDDSKPIADRMAAVNHMLVNGMGCDPVKTEEEFLKGCVEFAEIQRLTNEQEAKWLAERK